MHLELILTSIYLLFIIIFSILLKSPHSFRKGTPVHTIRPKPVRPKPTRPKILGVEIYSSRIFGLMGARLPYY